jgi:hypothetical protein
LNKRRKSDIIFLGWPVLSDRAGVAVIFDNEEIAISNWQLAERSSYWRSGKPEELSKDGLDAWVTQAKCGSPCGNLRVTQWKRLGDPRVKMAEVVVFATKQQKKRGRPL